MDMRKEIKRELGDLKKIERKLNRDLKFHKDKCWRQISQIEHSIHMGRKRTDKALRRIQRRQAILEGRLS